MNRLIGRLLQLSAAIAILLTATLACYTPWQKARTERTAIAQLALNEKSVYVPSDVTLLAEFRSSEQNNVDAGAGVSRIYLTSHSCEELIEDYRKAMEISGWTLGSIYDCDGELWLNMVNYHSTFIIKAAPSEDSPIIEEWRNLEEQNRDEGLLYYMIVNAIVDYEP
jgi:hypothetical protein